MTLFLPALSTPIGRSIRELLKTKLLCSSVLLSSLPVAAQPPTELPVVSPRQRININEGWRFYKYESAEEQDGLIYDLLPGNPGNPDNDEEAATLAVPLASNQTHPVLKPWILPSANRFIADISKRHERPPGDPGGDFPFVQLDFDDSAWEAVDLPHDWAIRGPFFRGNSAQVGGGMGRLPSPGVAWYRKVIELPESESGQAIFLDVDGAMSYAMVWLNGRLVGGWPYGYASWRLDLTPYFLPGQANQLAIRLENPPDSSRWYPGGGIYRNVWLTTTESLHVGQWGTFVTTRNVSAESATIDLQVTLDNNSAEQRSVEVTTEVYALNEQGKQIGDRVASFEPTSEAVDAGKSLVVQGSIVVKNPRLWGPLPAQKPHMHVAVTTLRSAGAVVDRYETPFGIRSLRFDPNSGVYVNGEHVRIQGVNMHHDLGPLGAAFQVRAAERQLEILQEMGCNAIRTAHNPPAPELLELTDRMGLLVVDEIFDVWQRRKTPNDFHLIFDDWHEADARSFIRRDRNHPSVVMWSVGNEVGEQYTGEEGAAVARRLVEIAKEEDPTRPKTAAMNYAKPDMAMPPVFDAISLNYQGEGIRNAPAYEGLRGISTPPLYAAFHERFPQKLILSSENAAALSSRGEYLFPVYEGVSAPVKNRSGGNARTQQISAYELYTAEFGSSADKVFAAQDRHPFVAGGFVWSGWDYLGEPTPYYSSRSSYFGILDLAGFKKDRFYLYQSYWRPDLPLAHILPHWNWPERIGEITPVHVFTTGDEAELFLNDKSLGRKQKGAYEYRLRWDDVRYEPGSLKVVAYKEDHPWAEQIITTTGPPAQLVAAVDRSQIVADGTDLAFVSVCVSDEAGRTVPTAKNTIEFRLDGPGELLATANGDPTSLIPFPSHNRPAFNGVCLAIVRADPGQAGSIKLIAESEGLQGTEIIFSTTRGD